MYAISIIPGIFTNNLVTANFVPKADFSNKNIGYHAPVNTSILENLTPFFIKTDAIGNAPYNGSAAADPKIKDNIIPFIPEPSPMNLIMVSLGTQTSKSPYKINIGGITRSISLKLNQ